jgi:hypothetical protein
MVTARGVAHALVSMSLLLMLARPAMGYVHVDFVHDETLSGPRTFCFYVDPGASAGQLSHFFPMHFDGPTSGELLLDGNGIATWKNERDPQAHIGLEAGVHSVTLRVISPGEVRVGLFGVSDSQSGKSVSMRQVDCDPSARLQDVKHGILILPESAKKDLLAWLQEQLKLPK